jgi:hypothetical protein
MKNTMFFALMILAALPASAQKAAAPNCSVNAEAMTALAEEYAARVDGLLRDAHASLQNISEAVEAGTITTERAQKLKLAVTRDIISRMDAISAVYDARLNLKKGVEIGSQEDAGATNKTAPAVLITHGTVSVQQLKREAAASPVTRTEEVTR